MVLFNWRVDETTEAGHAYVTLWLRAPREAIKALRSKQLPDWNQNKGETAVSVPLAAPNAEALRAALEAAIDKAIDFWRSAGGARQFLPGEQPPAPEA
jgi:hypothetical protein